MVVGREDLARRAQPLAHALPHERQETRPGAKLERPVIRHTEAEGERIEGDHAREDDGRAPRLEADRRRVEGGGETVVERDEEGLGLRVGVGQAGRQEQWTQDGAALCQFEQSQPSATSPREGGESAPDVADMSDTSCAASSTILARTSFS